MNSKKYKTLFNIIATIIVAMMFFSSCKNKIETIASLTDESGLPDQTTVDLNVSYSDSGFVKMNLITPKMEFYNAAEPYREFTQGLQVYQFSFNGDTTLNLSSKYAIYNETTKIWEAKHDVVVSNTETTLFTEQLFWDTEKHTLYTDSHVKIVYINGNTLYGKRLISDDALKNPKILDTSGDFYH